LDGYPINHFGRLNPNGSLDLNFDPAPDDYLTSILFEPNGKLLVGGGFTRISGQARAGVAQLDLYSPPQPVIWPPAQTVETGAPVIFAERGSGNPPPSCQWSFAGQPVNAATNSVFQWPAARIADAGLYQVVASNVADVATSAPAMLTVIPPVERRLVPGVSLTSDIGSVFQVDYADALLPSPNWLPLATVPFQDPLQRYFDVTVPFPPQRFYRASQVAGSATTLSLNLEMIPALTLTGNSGDKVRVDGINAIGPIDAWFTLDTVTLTNTSQLYFDVSALGQPRRLYRLVPVP
jgi:hypothetical protein